MASIYARGEVLWMKFKNAAGKPDCKSTGYRKGDEARALELAKETERLAKVERERAPSVATSALAAQSEPKPEASNAIPTPPPVAVQRIGSDAPPGALTVAAYTEQWLKRRVGIETAQSEAGRLRLHVVPLIGHMAIDEVRPRHVRDLINAIKTKTSDARKCKGELLAPRTVRLVFATLRLMFKSAVIDEHISASPVVVEAGVLPKNVDKDPEWRERAIFDRDELIAIISDERIPQYRRVFYALEGLAGVRHGEAAGLRWRHYHANVEPLGKLSVSRSGTKKRTKTQLTRAIPVHPTLAAILDAWKRQGWEAKYGRAPTADDLVLPTQSQEVRKPADTLKKFHADLKRLDMRARRGHDLRRTFVTLARVDGGRPEVLRPLTHPGEKDIIGLYTTFPWPVVCAEVAKLNITLPTAAPTPVAPANQGDQIVENPARTASSYSPSYTADCSPANTNESKPLRMTAGMGQVFRKP